MRLRHALELVVVLEILLLGIIIGGAYLPPSPPEDVNRDGVVDVIDVQLVVNAFLEE